MVSIQSPTTQYPSAGAISVSYSVKVVNPSKKTDYVIEKLHGVSWKFITVDEIRKAIEETCESMIEVPLRNMGYVEPGHGETEMAYY